MAKLRLSIVLTRIISTIRNWFKVGFLFPMFMDTQTNQPSITLTYSIISFLMAVASIVVMHWYKFIWPATTATIGFWFLATVLYIIRKINKASFDIDDREITLENVETAPKV